MSFKITVTKNFSINIPQLTTVQMRELGEEVVQMVVDRVQRRNKDSYDRSFPAYSNRPIYVPIKGRGASVRGRARFQNVTAYRNRRQELAGSKRLRGVKLSANKKTVKFPNRAAYKRFIGRSGNRDLTETGAMLNALGVISASNTRIVVGIKSRSLASKAAGQIGPGRQPIDWLPLSPNDARKVVSRAKEMFNQGK